jgi:opacity protein-like surface antigen
MNSFRQLSLVLLFVLLTSSAFAQKSSSGWSMLFNWDRFNAGPSSIGTVVDFQGNQTNLAGIGVEYLLMSQLALRVNFTYSSQSSEEDVTTTITEENSASTYGISFGPVWYFRGYNLSSVRPYLGATINIAGTSASRERTNSPKIETSSSSFGVTFFAGADLIVIEGLRVGAGYGLMYASFPSGTYEEAGQPEVEGPSGSVFTDVFHLNCKIMF